MIIQMIQAAALQESISASKMSNQKALNILQGITVYFYTPSNLVDWQFQIYIPLQKFSRLSSHNETRLVNNSTGKMIATMMHKTFEMKGGCTC